MSIAEAAKQAEAANAQLEAAKASHALKLIVNAAAEDASTRSIQAAEYHVQKNIELSDQTRWMVLPERSWRKREQFMRPM